MDSGSNRRRFLQQLAAGGALAALGIGNSVFGSGADQDLVPDESPPFRPLGEEPWDKIREEFSLGQQIYLNTGTIGLMPKRVLSDVNARLTSLSTGSYAVDPSVRGSVAAMLNAKASEISLTHNTTEGINIIAAGMRLKKGDEVILTDQEHVGNALPWLHQAKLHGFKIRVLALTPDMTAADVLTHLESKINRRTRAVALPHVTCTTGHVLPAKQIAALARSKGILSFFDGAHGPGMLFPDMQDIGCDFYAACGHKWLCAPAGTGMLFLREDMLERVTAQMVGAHSDTGWEISTEHQEIENLVNTAHRFDYGTQNPALITGLQGAIKFMESIGFERVRNRIAELGNYLQGKLLATEYVEMLTPTETISHAGMIGFRLNGKTIKDVESSELQRRFRIRLVPESGLNSIRISTHIFTSFTDIDEFVEEIGRFMKR